MPLGAAAAIAALTGCAAGTAATSAHAPIATVAASSRLVLRLATGSYATSGPRTTLRGSATPGATVKVDGHHATMHSGHWRWSLALHLGANHVRVSAALPGRAPAVRAITITRLRSPAEIEAQDTLRREAEARALAAHEAEAAARARREAEARAREQPSGAAKSPEGETTAACTNGTYVNAAGNTVCKPEQSPTAPAGATAKCEDGTYSFSESRSGTCSHHGGVAEWLSG